MNKPKDWILDSDRADILPEAERLRMRREEEEAKRQHEAAINAVTAANLAESAEPQQKAAAQQEIEDRENSVQQAESSHIEQGRYIAPVLETEHATGHVAAPEHTFQEAAPHQQEAMSNEGQPEPEGFTLGNQAEPEPVTQGKEETAELDEREARKQAVLAKLRADREQDREQGNER